MIRWIRSHPLSSFYLLAILFSWSVSIPLVFVRQGWTNASIPYSMHYLSFLGPALAGLLLTAVDSGRAGLHNLWNRITRWRVPEDYANFALFSVPFVFFAVVFTRRFITGQCTSLRELAQIDYLPYLGWLVLPIWLLMIGFGMEIGWRGFALPSLQRKMSATKASLLLGVGWVLWRLPTFFYHQDYLDMDWFRIAFFVIAVLAGSVVFSWLYNGTGGSILMVASWFALFDLFSVSNAGGDILTIALNLGVIVWALVVASSRKPWGIRQQARQVLPEE
ncbi:type II CAAX prenyl endopeptidase Rce1 family protein [Chloroflexota bacterium]